MLDFDQWCILIAFGLAVASIRGYRLISTTLFINFMVTEAVAITILKALGGPEGDPAWPLYAAYVGISGLTIVVLRYLRASPAFYTIMFLYSLYNLYCVVEFPLFNYFQSDWFKLANNNRKSVAEAQMIIELLFMLLISNWSAYVWNKFRPNRKYHYFVNRICSDCFRMGYKRLV